MADEEHPTKPMAGGVTKPRTRFVVSRYTPSSTTSRRLCSTLVLLLLVAGLTALILYLVYRPSKPRFSVASAAVYSLHNASASTSTSPSAPSNAISTRMQFTIVAHNPSDRSSILYDRLSAYVAYRSQPVTPPAPLPPLFQERGSMVAMSPMLGGPEFLPVSPEVVEGLMMDRKYGVVGLRFVLMGRIKYKSGPFRSRWVGMYVRCDMLLGLRKGVVGEVPLLGEPKCDVDV